MDCFTATNGKKLDEKIQSIEEKLQDMQKDIQNFQSQTVWALERLEYSNNPRKTLEEYEDYLRDDIL